MSYQSDRDRFIALATNAGLPLATAQKLLRHATTADRLAVALCNGDWPADNGERKTKECPQCRMGWAPSSFRRNLCPDCRNEALIHAALKDTGVTATVQGDPRGYVVKLNLPDGREIGVPTRNT